MKKKIVWLMKEYESGEYSSAIVFWYGILEQLGYEVMYYPYEQYDADEFYNEMIEYKPDFIFHVCYEKLHIELHRLRTICKVYVVQSDDDWRFDDYCKHYIPFVDGTISYQADRKLYIDAGAKDEQVISLKWGFNPNTMIHNSKFERDILISHVGGLHGDRVELLNEFKSKGMLIYVASRMKYEDILTTWRKSKYSLCFTKTSRGNLRQTKGRVIEIPYHCVLLTEPFPDLDQYMEQDKECILFNSIDEAIEKINFYESNEIEYNKIFDAGRKRLLNTNTMFHHWNDSMHLIDPDYKSVDINQIIKNFV